VICGEAEVCSRNEGTVEVKFEEKSQHFHHIILACGHRPDLNALPMIMPPTPGSAPDLVIVVLDPPPAPVNGESWFQQLKPSVLTTAW